MDQIVDNHVGRAKHVLTADLAPPANLEHDVGGLRGKGVPFAPGAAAKASLTKAAEIAPKTRCDL